MQLEGQPKLAIEVCPLVKSLKHLLLQLHDCKIPKLAQKGFIKQIIT